MQTNHPITEFICDFTNINFPPCRSNDCECINFLYLPFPALPGSIHAFPVSVFWELCVRTHNQSWLELPCSCAAAQPCALLLQSFQQDPQICLLYDHSGLLAEQFLKQFPTWGFWFRKNAVFLGNKLFFSASFMETRQRGRLPLHLLQASWHSSGWRGCLPISLHFMAVQLPCSPPARLPSACLPGWLSTWVAKSLYKSSWNMLCVVSKQSSFLKSS